MSGDDKKHTKLAEIKGNKSTIITEEVDKIESNNSQDSTEQEIEVNKSQKDADKLDVAGLGNNVADLSDKLVQDNSNRMQDVVSEIENNPMSKLLEEKLALKIEQKIEEHIDKEMHNAVKTNYFRLFIYVVGLSLFMVWIVWTIILILGMNS